MPFGSGVHACPGNELAKLQILIFLHHLVSKFRWEVVGGEGGVILESLRMASIIPFTFREAVDDVEYKGYLIPKGWKVMPLFRNIHHNPKYFSNPEVFDPSRFEVITNKIT
ncbi:hypothetical protein F2Q70_00010151 [Brassica cretica]|uniref:Cytochrome P450 n=1 Tax=Brassica cretica TaxID=69181 RepID=A0A8S9M766_BRACR|nr:hypothetical protein F2Q70_00010151 [Brassica cretica]